ncbi:MAG: ATP-binding cassette domain-containing protein [Desulfobulbaceae bacterium]|nr:ATP-binding cassette domain-containing protein [Desulfobulbaceae bacterium]
MALLTLNNITASFGGLPILNHVDLQIEPGERLCLVGRNGEGKSTLMKVISGEIKPDSGEITAKQGLKISRLEQEVPGGDVEATVFEMAASGLGPLVTLVADYHRLVHELAENSNDRILAEFERVQHAMEAAGGWLAQQRVETVLSRLQLPPDERFSSLSGGYKRRVLLAKALVAEPDLLLLDEPTNHLDIESIRWLEDFLLDFGATLLFVTHDRMLLRHLATRIIELDRGELTSWPGDYETYLRRKQDALDAEAGQQARFDKKLAQEEIWIRKGIKARRTRNEGRVTALEKMRVERSQRRNRQGNVRINIQEMEKSGKLVVTTEAVNYAYDNKPIIRDLTATVMRGDRVGIIGPNGAGKTTLLQVLLGQLAPDSGTVRLGTNLQIAYFDQLRAQLDGEKSVQDNVGEGNDQVVINGRQRHIIGYLQDFLFSPDRARSPVKILSGGERNRLLLAKLFTKPSNLLVLDEPTNDLDVETLELLEELLLDYPGTILLVSHDRAFLNNVVTSTMVFEENGKVADYAGGYDDWLAQRVQPPAAAKDSGKASPPPPAVAETQPLPTEPGKRKLSYKETKELAELPARIEALEQEQATLTSAMADPAFFRDRDAAAIAAATARLASLEQELHDTFSRWEELEARHD